MSEIRLVLTDLDGTVAPMWQDVVSDAVRQSIMKCEAAGIQVVPVTGRPYEMAKPLMDHLGFDSYCVVDGGATIQQVQTGEILWKKWLAPEVLRKMVEVVLPFATVIDFEPGNNERDAREVSIEQVAKESSGIFAVISSEAIDEIRARLLAIPDIYVVFHAGHADKPDHAILEAGHVAATKYHGVEELRSLLAFDRSSTLAIGDSNNDIPLFQNAGLKIAMGNATDELKVLADHIVADVDHDGFVEAMNRFVLN